MFAWTPCKLIIISYLCIIGITIGESFLFLNVYPKLDTSVQSYNASAAGPPLIITPFIRNGSIVKARELSRVEATEKCRVISHAGFFTVDDHYDSNLFTWYFPPLNTDERAPVILWLQGGPGGSSLFGLFTELGPLIAKKDGFKVRKYNWATNFHLIFIDNPVGTGFSYTNNSKGYCRDENCVATNLHNCLLQFFTLFPNLRDNDFYIAGESYAGKYIPSLAMFIHKQNSKKSSNINLKGLLMGNAYCDPINQLEYGKYLYQHGMLDNNQIEIFEYMQRKITKAIKKENWELADILMDELLDGQLANSSFFKSYTGFTNYYNILQSKEDDSDIAIFMNMLNNEELRKSVHVGDRPFSQGPEVALYLRYDLLKSVASVISELLSHYKLLFYNGQLDIVVAYPLTENFLRNLPFSGSEEYLKAPRHIWRVDGEIAGYIKSAGNLTEVLVRNAGHFVPRDQPKWTFNLLNKFIKETSSSKKEYVLYNYLSNN